MDRRTFMKKAALHFGYDRQDIPGAGAAGGLGYAFLQYLHADCRSGIDLLLETVRFDELLSDADFPFHFTLYDFLAILPAITCNQE